jgi:hypothetical protein
MHVQAGCIGAWRSMAEGGPAFCPGEPVLGLAGVQGAGCICCLAAWVHGAAMQIMRHAHMSFLPRCACMVQLGMATAHRSLAWMCMVYVHVQVRRCLVQLGIHGHGASAGWLNGRHGSGVHGFCTWHLRAACVGDGFGLLLGCILRHRSACMMYYAMVAAM